MPSLSKAFWACAALVLLSWAVAAGCAWYLLLAGGVAVLPSVVISVGFSVFSTYELRAIYGYERRERA